MLDDPQVLDRTAADKVLLDDALEGRRTALAVPRSFRVDDRDRAPFADTEAIGLRAEHAPLIGESEFVQPLLEEVPRGDPAFLVTALRLGLIGTEKDVATGDRDSDGGGDLLLCV